MAGNWEYSNFSHTAKLNGGPKEYVEQIKKQSFIKGMLAGRSEGRVEGLVIGGIIVIVGVVTYEGYKAYMIRKEKCERENTMAREEGEKKAEKVLKRAKTSQMFYNEKLEEI